MNEDLKSYPVSTSAPPHQSQTPQNNQWINIGPAPVTGVFLPSSGRVSAIAIDPVRPDHWMAAAAQGGVWETQDGGLKWQPRTDDQASLAMGAISFAPSNSQVLYAGTGEPFTQDGFNGQGLLKSTDAGVSWSLLGADIFAELAFRNIKIHPTNSNIILAALSLPPRETKSPVKPPGLFKSTDGGMTWAKKLEGNAADLEVDPINFNNLYFAVSKLNQTGITSLYRSSNGGESWTTITGPWNRFAGKLGRISLAIAPSNSNILYVSVAHAFNGSLLGVWKTDNAWALSPIWSSIPLSFKEYQMDRNHKIIIDPANPSVFYLGGTQLWKFNGSTWSNIRKNIHVDQQTMAWSGNRLIVGNDGGVFSSIDRGATWRSHNTNLSITQFYKGSLHPRNPYFILAGGEDNGNDIWTGSNTWQDVLLGDGADNAISFKQPDTDWAVSSYNAQIFRTIDGGKTFSRADGGIDKTSIPFIAHFEKCPSNDDIFLAGSNRLWKSTNFFSGPAADWTIGSPVLPSGDTIQAMAFAPADILCNIYAFGTKKGSLQLTKDGGLQWIDIDASQVIPNRTVTDLAFDPTDPNILYVSLAGYDGATPGHLFKTTNALAPLPIWANISPPEDIPINTVVLDPSDQKSLYIGADRGVWKTINGGKDWIHMGPESGMPNVAVFDLELDPATRRVLAFTHGRGSFILSLTGEPYARPQND